MRDFFIPIDGLSVSIPWNLGPVCLLDPSRAREQMQWHPGAKIEHEMSVQRVDDFIGGVRTAVAHVQAESDETAIDLTTTALDVLRVFQQTRTVYRTTMFGLPGEVPNSLSSILRLGDDAIVVKHHRGYLSGWSFTDDDYTNFVTSSGFVLAASAIGKEPEWTGEAERRSLIGLQLASRAILEHRLDMQWLYSMMAAEALLLADAKGSQTFRLARRCAFLLCEQCGEKRGCPFLSTSPDAPGGPRKLNKLHAVGDRQRCREWHDLVFWYDIRSEIVHGQRVHIYNGAGQVLFWLLHSLIPRVLEWYVAHPDTPVTDLDDDIDRSTGCSG